MALSPTANQGARPHTNAPIDTPEHLTSKAGNSAHYSIRGQNVPTSGGANRSHFQTDRQRQGPTKLYLGRTGQGSEKVKFTKGKGNSTGRVVTEAARARLSKQGQPESKAKGKPYGGLPFRREGPAFGPVKDSVKRQYAQGSRTAD